MRDWDDFERDPDPWFGDDGYDDLPMGMAECPTCGMILPEDHLETDSGDCIGCEDARYWVNGDRDDAED